MHGWFNSCRRKEGERIYQNIRNIFHVPRGFKDKIKLYDHVRRSIEKTLNLWKWRKLTLLGKLQLTFIPKIANRSTIVNVSAGRCKESNTLLFGFLWMKKLNGQH